MFLVCRGGLDGNDKRTTDKRILESLGNVTSIIQDWLVRGQVRPVKTRALLASRKRRSGINEV